MEQPTKQIRKSKKRIWIVGGVIILTILVGVGVLLRGIYLVDTEGYEQEVRQVAETQINQLIDSLEEEKTMLEQEEPQEVFEPDQERLVPSKKQTQRSLESLLPLYEKALNQMKDQDIQLAYHLIAQGKADWAALVSKGENTLANKQKLASEYIAKGRVLEQQMDENFNQLLATIEVQLEEEGIEAEAVLKDYRAKYQSIKETNKKKLMQKITKAVS